MTIITYYNIRYDKTQSKPNKPYNAIINIIIYECNQ